MSAPAAAALSDKKNKQFMGDKNDLVAGLRGSLNLESLPSDHLVHELLAVDLGRGGKVPVS